MIFVTIEFNSVWQGLNQSRIFYEKQIKLYFFTKRSDPIFIEIKIFFIWYIFTLKTVAISIQLFLKICLFKKSGINFTVKVC